MTSEPPGAEALPEIGPLPALSPARTRTLDEHLVTEVGLPLAAMMENAGRNLARAARWWPDADRVAVLAGKGNNGGGGLACARHLDRAGRDVRVHLAVQPDELGPAPARQLSILDASEVRVRRPGDELGADPPDLVVDALLGYAQRGPPRGGVRDRLEQARRLEAATLALDVPTGLDPAEGTWHSPALAPEATVALGLPKAGLARADPAPGLPAVADVGIPSRVYADLGVDPHPFVEAPLGRWTGTRGEA